MIIGLCVDLSIFDPCHENGFEKKMRMLHLFIHLIVARCVLQSPLLYVETQREVDVEEEEEEKGKGRHGHLETYQGSVTVKYYTLYYLY